jgi:tape measure domain-containing protein
VTNNDLDMRFGADTAPIEAGARRAEGAIRDFGSRSRDELGRFTKQSQDMQTQVVRSLDAISSKLKTVFAGFSAAMVVKEVVSVMSSFENLEIRLRSVMGSVEKGDEAFAWIKKFAKDTPFEVEGVTQAFMLLKNMGLDPMDGTMQAIADQAAKSGQGIQGLERVSLALGQAFTKGKLQGEEMNQLLEAGVPAWDLLAKATGKNTAELHKLSEKGALGKDVIKALIEEIGRASANSSGAMMQSLSGQWSNAMDNIKNSLDDMRKAGGLDGLKDALGQINDRFAALNDSGDLQTFVADVGQGFSALASSAMSIITTLLDAVGELVGTIMSGFGQILDATTNTFGGEPLSGIELFANMLKVIEIAVVALVTAFNIVKEGVVSAIEQMVFHVLRFSEAAERALALDFDGAKAAWSRGGAEIERIAGERFGNMVKIADDAQTKMENIALRPMAGGKKAPTTAPAASAADGPRRKVEYNKEADKKEHHGGAARAAMQAAEIELATLRMSHAKKQAEAGTFFEFSKAQEIDFWRSKLASMKAGSAEAKAVDAKLHHALLSEAEKSNANALQALHEGEANRVAAAHAQVETERAAARARLDLRQISADQMVQVERELADRELAITRGALDEAIKLEESRPDKNPARVVQLKGQIQRAEQTHASAVGNIDQQVGLSAQRAGDVRRNAMVESALAAAQEEGAAGTRRLTANGATQAELIGLEILTQETIASIRRTGLENQLMAEQAGPNDPTRVAELQAQIEALTTGHVARMNALTFQQAQALKDSGGSFQTVLDGMPNAAGQAIDGVLGKFGTLRDGLTNLFKGIYATFVSEMVTKPLTMAAMRVIRESALYKMMAGVQVATQAGASAATVSTKAGEAGAVVGANAAEAASGAAASQASIPFAGPVMAAAAFAGIMALVMGAKGSIRSAAGGFDIPAGMNPITQLHQKEMVLPAKHADTIRRLGESGGGNSQAQQSDGGNITVPVTYNDHSGQLSDDDIRRKSNLIGDIVMQQIRNNRVRA